MPRCAGDVSVGCENVGVFLQELNFDAWPCRVIGASDIAAVGEAKPAAYQDRLFVMCEGAWLAKQVEIRPGRKSILARDAGLRVMKAKLKRDDFTIRAVCRRWEDDGRSARFLLRCRCGRDATTPSPASSDGQDWPWEAASSWRILVHWKAEGPQYRQHKGWGDI
jgi:hypothetical protein